MHLKIQANIKLSNNHFHVDGGVVLGIVFGFDIASVEGLYDKYLLLRENFGEANDSLEVLP